MASALRMKQYPPEPECSLPEASGVVLQSRAPLWIAVAAVSAQLAFWVIVVGLESAGNSQLWWAGPFALLLMFMGIGATIAGLVLLFARHRAAWAVMITGGATILFVFGGSRAARVVRMHVFSDLAERSDYLIGAIEFYCHRFDRPPDRIASLVPDILNDVPRTGLPSYPEYEMLPISDGATRHDWGIVVRCPIGISSSDMFVYWPSEMYPEYIDGGRVRRMGRWAYVAGM